MLQDEELVKLHKLDEGNIGCSSILTYLFECRLRAEFNKEIEIYACGDEKLNVSCCFFTYNNRDIIETLIERGKIMT